ncbi:uncharacterized protein LOC126368799 [Pectinophora gossypiella]|uniref:uncharacterized protein LOC126368799 n=1 Tax=Pectinophora gossypiella TaxID=13191 RepID=UPI00214E7E0B|nr:uncharacterized protein LOC126368799 [Pectinophora gossypiella]
MGKRRHKKDQKEIRRKIRRLEKKLRRNEDTDHSSRSPSVSSEYDNRYWSADEIEEGYQDEPLDNEHLDMERDVSPVVNVPSPRPSSSRNLDIAPPTDVTLDVDAPVRPASTPADPSEPSTSAVPEEILCMLGEAKKIEQALGEKIPPEISERWGKILLDGLAKEQKNMLTEKTLIPENFLLARAPKLNPEVVAVLSDAVKNRDKRLEKAQNQLGLGIAGLVNLTKDLINSDIDKLNIIKRISEVSQLLLDLHYEESINRRKLIVPLLDKKFWNTIQGVKRDNFLFGEKLGDNIKNSKDIEKFSQQIKKASVPSTFQRKTPGMMTGNVRFPPRPHSNVSPATPAAGRYFGPRPQAPARRNYNSPPQRGNKTAPHNKTQDHRRR